MRHIAIIVLLALAMIGCGVPECAHDSHTPTLDVSVTVTVSIDRPENVPAFSDDNVMPNVILDVDASGKSGGDSCDTSYNERVCTLQVTGKLHEGDSIRIRVGSNLVPLWISPWIEKEFVIEKGMNERFQQTHDDFDNIDVVLNTDKE